MAGELGYLEFPGLRQVMSASYTLNHGIAPGILSIETVPQPNFTAGVGDAVFVFGSQRIKVRDCKLVDHAYARSGQGTTWRLSFQDHRWRWAYGSVEGHYNLRNPEDGRLLKHTEKTPREMAEACLKEMGETRYTVGDLPNDLRPEVHWDLGTNPAQALDALCQQSGCRVVLQLDGSVSIRRIGKGRALPANLPVADESLSIDPPIGPDKLVIVCGKTRYEMTCRLEAVGLDTDERVKPIDELSYKPTAGWDYSSKFFREVDPAVDDTTYSQPRELARQTVFKWYRITTRGLDGGPLRIPGFPSPVNRIEQVLPLEDNAVRWWTGPQERLDANFTPLKEYAEALVWGVYYIEGLSFANTPADSLETDAATPYRAPFTIDVDRGIVMFDNATFKYTASGGGKIVEPADLALRCAVSVRWIQDWHWERYFVERVRPQKKLSTKPRYEVHDEIVLNWFPNYDERGRATLSESNAPDVKKEANYYLDAMEQEYQFKTPEGRTYGGLWPIEPDGAIQEVSWSVGGGAFTHVSRNNEQSATVPPYQMRQFLNTLAEQNKQAMQAKQKGQ